MIARAERNREIVDTMLANGLAGRYDIVRRYIAEEYECHLPAGLPYGGIYLGWDGYTQVFDKMSAFFADVAFGPTELQPAEDKVVVLSHVKGTLRRTFDQPLIEVWELADEMVTRITAYYFDTKQLCDLNEARP